MSSTKLYHAHITRLIAENKIKEALQEAQNLLQNSPLFYDLILQSARFKEVMKAMSLGTINFESGTIERNKVIEALNYLMKEMEEENQIVENKDVQKEIESYIENRNFNSRINGDSNINIQDISNGSISIVQRNTHIHPEGSNKSKTAKELYEEGIEYLLNEDWKNALNSFSRLIARNENLAKAYCNQGYAHLKLEQRQLAITSFEKAIENDPNLWAALHSLGLLYIDFEEIDKGCNCLKKAKDKHLESKMAYEESVSYTHLTLPTNREV